MEAHDSAIVFLMILYHEIRYFTFTLGHTPHLMISRSLGCLNKRKSAIAHINNVFNYVSLGSLTLHVITQYSKLDLLPRDKKVILSAKKKIFL